MEARLGHDFWDVNVHTGSEAAAAAAKVQARAFTLGRDIVFGAGHYSPDSMAGRRLLAHELAHVVQQAGAAMPSGAEAVEISSPHDPAEREAEAVADRVVRPQTSNDVPPLPRRAHAHVQRACGTALAPPRTPCQPSGVPVAGQHFAFVVNCDDLQPGEAASIVAFARTLLPGTRLRVHGYASEEGPASFNHTLSCARANVVAERLRTARTDCPVVAVIEHGPETSPAGRAYWRAASVEEIRPQAIAAEDCGRYVGSCEFYRCRQRRAPSSFPPTGYYLGYGLKYCERFSTRTRPRLSHAGQRWVDMTLYCLQAWIHSHLRYDTDPDTVKASAFRSHPDCYVQSGLCFLSPADWLEIWNTIDSADNDLRQVLATAVYCGANVGVLVIPGSLAAGGGFHGLMERDWQRNFGQPGTGATTSRPFPPPSR
jgi:outer membrane protein OmpA-like peptidoglycan-associated protein